MDIKNKIQQQLTILQTLEKHRRRWLILSSIVFASAAFIIYDWFQIQNHTIHWTLSALGVLISIIWWYWTMRLIRILLQHRLEDRLIMAEIIEDVKYIRTEVLKNLPK